MSEIKHHTIYQSIALIFFIILLMAAASPIKADVADSHPLYLYYFETDDVLLQTGQTQAYQFTAFRGEKVTIVVYGLDELVRPEITLYGADGETVATGRSSAEQPFVRSVEFTATHDETLTFEVTALEAVETGGLARVMLVEGDPISGDLTYLDTVNPLLPGRVFMVAGSDEIDRDVTQTEVGIRTGAEVLPVQRFRDKPDIFVSRGSSEELPPIAERFDPGTSHVWFNEGGDKVYFFTVHAIPEQLTSATQQVEYEALNLLTFFYFDYFFIVGAGSDPVLLSQETQPCSEVTLENRVNCERTAPAQRGPDEETQPAAAAPVPVLPPDDTFFVGFSGCYLTYGSQRYYGDYSGYPYYPYYIFGPDYYYVVYPTFYDFYYLYAECYGYTYSLGSGSGLLNGDAGGVVTDDVLYGGGGGDTINGLAGDDFLVGDDVTSYSCWAINPYGFTFTYTCYPYTWYGGVGNDTINGGVGNDTIYAGGGNDGVSGGDGNDTIAGDDVFVTQQCTYQFVWYSYYDVGASCTAPTTDYEYSGNGSDSITGGNGDDTIYGGGGDDLLYGDDIPDPITGFAESGNDTIYGGLGNDTINGGPGTDTLYGGVGDDIVNGATGNDTLYGDAGHDTMNGGTGTDTLYGGTGNDSFVEQPGSNSDTYDGGVGYDSIDYTLFDAATNVDITFTISSNGTTIQADTAVSVIGTPLDSITDVENYIGSGADDTFTISGTFGNTAATAIGISGGTGTDTVTFAAGTTGYFILTGIQTAQVCAAVPPCTALTTSATFVETSPGSGLFVQWASSAAPLLAVAAARSETWDLSGAVGGSADGGAGSDTYRLGVTPSVNIADSGQSGVDTVSYAVNAAALTIAATAETDFTVSDGTATATLDGVENVTTGSANDIFLLNYDPNGVSNTYDAAEDATNTDMDSAVIRTDHDLTVTISNNTAVVNQTGTTSTADTLVNFESVATGAGDDTFVMNTTPDGLTLNGGSGLNSIVYDTSADLVVDVNAPDSMTVSTDSSSDTVLNFDTVTTGAGNDVVNFDVNAADTNTAYTVNAAGGFNLFNFLFHSNEPLTDTVNVTVAADGTNNVLDFSGVDAPVTIDTANNTPQEVFTNFWLTIQGVFEVVFGTDEVQPEPTVAAAAVTTNEESTPEPTEAATVESVVATCPTETVETTAETPDVTETMPESATSSTAEATPCDTATPEPTVAATEAAAEMTESTVVATEEATAEATLEVVPTIDATPTPEPTLEATPTPEPPVAATPEPPLQSTPTPETTDQP